MTPLPKSVTSDIREYACNSVVAHGTAIHAERPNTFAPPLHISFSWTLAGNLIFALCQFGILSTLARLGSPSIVGQYALGLAITAPVFSLTNLHLRGLQATDARRQFEFADYFTLRSLSTLTGMLAVLLLMAFLPYDSTTKAVIALVAAAKAIETVGDVIAGQLQNYERLDQVARALMIRGLVSVGMFAAVFWLTRNLIAAVATLSLAWLGVIALYDFRVVAPLLDQHRPFFHCSAQKQKALLCLSWPLGLVMALVSLNANIPRYVLEHYLGSHELGVFASLAYLITGAGLVINALGESASARLSRMFADRQFDAFISLIRSFLLIGALLGIIGVPLGALLSRQIISMLYGPEYANYLSVFLVMIATFSISTVASFLGYAVTAARSFRVQISAVGASVAVAAVGSILLVPNFGLMGAALALLFASVAQAIGLALLLNFEINRARAHQCSPELH
jgi:O-antigen/teichoic acid export membrane protein